MHNHEKCVHEIKFCANCDVVYCEKCKDEWKKNWSNLTYTTGPNYGTGGGIVLCSSDCGTTPFCQH